MSAFACLPTLNFASQSGRVSFPTPEFPGGRPLHRSRGAEHNILETGSPLPCRTLQMDGPDRALTRCCEASMFNAFVARWQARQVLTLPLPLPSAPSKYGTLHRSSMYICCTLRKRRGAWGVGTTTDDQQPRCARQFHGAGLTPGPPKAINTRADSVAAEGR